MHRCLLIKAFEKAKKDIGSSTTQRRAVYLSDYILESSNQPYGSKMLSINYNKAIKNSDGEIEFKQFVVQALCEYLGYKDFKDFDGKNQCDEGDEFFWKKSIKFIKKYWVLILFIILTLVLALSLSIKKQKWMVWEEDHYVEVKFDTEKYKVSELKLYSQDRILYFKKITPDCDTDFFKPNGIENLWYGKSVDGELEFFTSLGQHPETGKTLKAITVHMIKQHICETYR